jgi:ribosomal protein S18 acetylase RimI-like enzyme
VQVTLSPGFASCEREEAARLFWSAFAGKLDRVLGPDRRALDYLARVLNPERSLVARARCGTMLGMAGFKTGNEGLISGSFADLVDVYGRFGALWRGALLDLTQRPLGAGEMLLDGLFVAEGWRGAGVGSSLIAGVVEEARARHCACVRLEVIDTNPRARSLYRRHGFRSVGVRGTPLLLPVFGFRRLESMVRPV